MEIIQPVSYYRVKSRNLLVHNVQIYKGEEENCEEKKEIGGGYCVMPG